MDPHSYGPVIFFPLGLETRAREAWHNQGQQLVRVLDQTEAELPVAGAQRNRWISCGVQAVEIEDLKSELQSNKHHHLPALEQATPAVSFCGSPGVGGSV